MTIKASRKKKKKEKQQQQIQIGLRHLSYMVAPGQCVL